MTIEEIQAKVERIRDLADDTERSHGAEDSLYLQFIQYVSTLTTEDPLLPCKAKEVLKSRDVIKERWYA